MLPTHHTVRDRPPRTGSPWFAIAFSVGIHAGLILPALFLALLPQVETVAALAPEPISAAFCVQLGTLRQTSVEPVNTGVPAPSPTPEAPGSAFPISTTTEPLRMAVESPAALVGSGSSATPGAAPGGAGGNGGGPGRATFLKAPMQARSVVYVLDRSLSMGLNGALALATSELLASLGELPETTQFQVICYNRVALPMRLNDSTALQPATEENRRQVAARLAVLLAREDTDHLNALKQALALQPDLIFFVTDGDGLSTADVALVTRLNRGRCTIDTIEVRTARVEEGSPLGQLARANGGTYQVIDPSRAAGNFTRVANPVPPAGPGYSWPQSRSDGH